jgi:ATP-binding protein involved in chromosome partitioning
MGTCVPQDIALIDARRGAVMWRKVAVPILGLIENMSYFQCPKCHHQEYIFGQDGAVRTAEDMDMELLGQVRVVFASAFRGCL